ncbi:MAG: pyruvate carboxylase subunit B [Chloroflexi bacterium]|nr:pyruvate carboxylase subunit B [Chloroflexota bacterium]
MTDLSLRDGHQSMLATRMRTNDILEVIHELDEIGFASLEVWGGATFDVMTRFLNEDPWERITALKKAAPKTPFMMLLRGQNLVGYRNYPDDVVEAFAKHAAETGIDIFRVFDALNDERNFETAFRAIGDAGKHIQGTVCYSVTERRMGGPVFNREYFVTKAKTIESMGAHSLCLKDRAGLLAPYDAYELISALKDAISIPIQLHSHYTSGMAQMTQLKAIEAGVDIVDTALSPLALRSSHPPIEPLMVALEGTPRDTGFDLTALINAGQSLEAVLQRSYRHLLTSETFSLIDTSVLTHQVPGGMTTNLSSQLKEAEAIDRLPEVLEELPRTRRDLGYPPLVTPTSQIVGIQAVQNVLFGRYNMISTQVKDYAFGLYGRPPLPMDPEVVARALKRYERGETPTTVRPADILDPELEKVRRDAEGLTKNDGDVLIYALYPITGQRFLRWKYGLEAPPPEVSTEPAPAATTTLAAIAPTEASPRARTYNVFVGTEQFQVVVDPTDEDPGPQGRRPVRVGIAKPTPPPPAPTAARPSAAVTAPSGGSLLMAPMPGLVVSYAVTVGQRVKAGDTIVVVEAMKMQNNLPSPIEGVVLELPRQPGDRVGRGDVLAVIGPPPA